MAKKFSEVAKTEPIFKDAEYIQDKSVLKGKNMVIESIAELESSTGKYVVVLATMAGKKISFSIGGVVCDQLIKIKSELPVEAVMDEAKSKEGRLYYTLK